MSTSIAKKERAEQIIRRHADMVYRIALQNLKNPADAEDIFQDVALTLLTKNAPLYDDVHIKNWLIRVTINKCNNFRRTPWQSRTEPLSLYTDVATEPNNSALELLYTLPKKYRNVIYLYYYEEYTVPEIAEILGENKNTVNSRLQRARKKLKEILKEGDNL